jgi:hypothetical protein
MGDFSVAVGVIVGEHQVTPAFEAFLHPLFDFLFAHVAVGILVEAKDPLLGTGVNFNERQFPVLVAIELAEPFFAARKTWASGLGEGRCAGDDSDTREEP